MRLTWVLLGIWSLVIAGWWLKVTEPRSGARHAVQLTGNQVNCVADMLREYARREGRYPTNDEGLGVFTASEDGVVADWKEGFSPARGLGHGFRGLAPVPGGIEDWHGILLMYENRAGLPAEAFASSPADRYAGTGSCARVDSGVFVYSLSALELVDSVRKADARALLCAVLWGPAALFCFTMAVIGPRKRPSRAARIGARIRQRGGNAALALGLVLVGGLTCMETMVIACYPGTVLAMRRRPGKIAKYTQLLEEFHSRGVIREETYKKLKEVISEEAYEERQRRRYEF